jgi:hypothetical protein
MDDTSQSTEKKPPQNANFIGGYYTLIDNNITKSTLFFKDTPNTEEIEVVNNNVDMKKIKEIFDKHIST